jgi:hypothetical protein
MTKAEFSSLQSLIEWDDQDQAVLPARTKRARKIRTQTRSARKPVSARQAADFHR